jgi:hypothetical protein
MVMVRVGHGLSSGKRAIILKLPVYAPVAQLD